MIAKSRLIAIARPFHGIAALYNLAFVYTPLHSWPYGFAVVQYISMPLLLISGAALVRARKKLTAGTSARSDICHPPRTLERIG